MGKIQILFMLDWYFIWQVFEKLQHENIISVCVYTIRIPEIWFISIIWSNYHNYIFVWELIELNIDNDGYMNIHCSDKTKEPDLFF